MAKYDSFLDEAFIYPLSSGGFSMADGVKPILSKFAELVVGQLLAMLVETEVQLTTKQDTSQALQG